MKILHAKRLMKLARFLNVLPPEKFDYRTVVKGANTPTKKLDCGSTACAIGWCPVLWPKLVKYHKPEINYSPSDFFVVPMDHTDQPVTYAFSKVLFGLTNEETSGLFLPYGQKAIGFWNLTSNATPKQVATLIAAFVGREHPQTDTSL